MKRSAPKLTSQIPAEPGWHRYVLVPWIYGAETPASTRTRPQAWASNQQHRSPVTQQSGQCESIVQHAGFYKTVINQQTRGGLLGEIQAWVTPVANIAPRR